MADKIKSVWILEFEPYPDSPYDNFSELAGVFDTREQAIAAIPIERDVEWRDEAERSLPIGYDAWGQRWYCHDVMANTLLVFLGMRDDDESRVR
jgi:hypothetical protein